MQITKFSDKYGKYIYIFICVLLFLFSSLLLIKSVRAHYRFISYPYQLEYREGGALCITKVFLEHKNPYSIQEQPQNTYVYGFLYPLAVTPFADMFGNTLLVHRSFVYFFILATCLLVFFVLIKMNVNFAFAFAAMVILHQSIINAANTAIARPEGLGIFLFTLGLIIPWKWKFSKASLAASVVLGILGYLTKPYYVLVIPIISAYLFIFISKRKSLIYTSLSFLFLFISVAVVTLFFPFYLNNTIVAHIKDSLYSFDYMLDQVVEYLILNASLIVIIICSYILIYRKILKDKSIQNEEQPQKYSDKIFQINHNLKLNQDEPFIKSGCDLFFIFSFVFSLFLFIIKLGGHPGNFHAAYLFHLASPALVLAVFQLLPKTSNKIFQSIAAILIMVSLNFQFRVPKYTFDKFAVCYKQMEEIIKKSKNTLNSPENVSILINENKPVYNTGLSEYFSGKKNKSHILGPAPDEVFERMKEFQKDIDDKIAGREFDLILISRDNYSFFIKPDLLKENYVMSGTSCGPFIYHETVVERWIPKKTN